MIDNIVYLICNLLRVYLIHRFIRLFFEDVHVNKKLETGAYGLFFVINSVLYLGLHTAWINLICNIAGSIFLLMLYTRSWKYLLFVSTLLNVASVGSDVLATSYVLSTYQDGDTINALSFIVVDMILFICVQLINKFLYVNNKNDTLPSILLVLVPGSSIGIIYMMVYMQHHLPIEIIMVSMGILLINFLVLYLYNMLLESMTQKYENKMLDQKVHTYKTQLEVILETEQRVRQMQHDMKHHLTEIRLMAGKHNDKDIEDYICNMEYYMSSSKEFVYSDNQEIDSLLNYMLGRAKEEQLNISAKVKIPKNMEHSFNINVILGNLLDNAIEAAAKSEEKNISVSVIMNKGILRIRVENSYNGKVNRSAGRFMTTKSDKEKHGLGIQSVREIVKQYNGDIDFYVGDTFRVIVILYM
ncbi:MAG: GHKL domain-containing protein [Lachnospiraceae bacterium]|nr:GHKL domain-containing protein [Lachnospiraceae bacterium]